jgi:hypothetical protein
MSEPVKEEVEEEDEDDETGVEKDTGKNTGKDTGKAPDESSIADLITSAVKQFTKKRNYLGFGSKEYDAFATKEDKINFGVTDKLGITKDSKTNIRIDKTIGQQAKRALGFQKNPDFMFNLSKFEDEIVNSIQLPN